MQILKKKLLPFFSAFLVGLALTGGTVLAHTMPFSETTLILEKRTARGNPPRRSFVQSAGYPGRCLSGKR